MNWVLALGIVGVVLAGLVAYTRFHLHFAEQRHPPRAELITVDGVQTHVLHRGAGNGQPLLLLHGLNGVLEDFTGALIDRLAEDHEVIAVDRPGYGYTDRPTGRFETIADQTEWLDALLDALDVDDVLLVGHSLGGAIATRYTIDHPDRVRGLVLLAPYLFPNETPPDALHGLPDLPLARSLIAHLFVAPIGRPLARWLAKPSFDPEPLPPGYTQLWADLSLRPQQFLTVLHEARHLEAHVTETAPRYREISVPVSILVGEADQLIHAAEHAERFHAAAPNAWLRRIPGAGHMLPWTQPVQVLNAITEVEHLAAKRSGGNGHAHPGA